MTRRSGARVAVATFVLGFWYLVEPGVATALADGGDGSAASPVRAVASSSSADASAPIAATKSVRKPPINSDIQAFFPSVQRRPRRQ